MTVEIKDCGACGRPLPITLDPGKVLRVEEGWVTYPCEWCAHVNRLVLRREP